MKPAIFAAVVVMMAAMPAHAADRIVIKVGYSPGGAYDQKSRLVATHLGRLLDGNPEIIVENVPGAGSLKLAKLFQKSGATDGSEIAVIGSALALRPVFKPEDGNFDPRNVNYIAATSNEGSYCVTFKGSGIDSFEKLLASDAKVGATGKSSTTYTFPAAIKSAYGASFQVLPGFGGGEEIFLAMERGDVDARCGTSPSALLTRNLVDRMNILAEIALEPKKRFGETPFVLGLAPKDKKAALALVIASTEIHHPFVLHGNTDPEIVQTYRNAFMALAQDKEFLADAERRGILLGITPGDMVETIIDDLLASPADVKEQARNMVK